MKNKKTIITLILGLVIIIIFFSSAFIVSETEQVVITRFGKPIGETISTPGVHFKIPLIEEANFFEKRFLEWDGDANQIPTKGKKFIWVDTYARWRIADALLFFQRVRDERGAQARLDDILDGETRNAIANHDLHEIIRNTNREPDLSGVESAYGPDAESVFPTISIGREKITRKILEVASKRTIELG